MSAVQPASMLVASFFSSAIDTLLRVVYWPIVHVLFKGRGSSKLHGCGSSPSSQKSIHGGTPAMSSTCNSVLGDLSQLPEDLVVNLAQSLSMSDLAALGRVSSAGRQQIWQQPGLWRGLAERSGIDTSPCFAIPSMSGTATREAFRRCTYKLDVDHMEALSSAAQNAGGDRLAELLNECAWIASGMMPTDDIHLVESLIGAAEQALQAHDPTYQPSSEAAEELLVTMRRRFDIFSWFQRERLECARANAEHLHATMDDLVDKPPGVFADPDDVGFSFCDSFPHRNEDSAWTPNVNHGVVDEQRLEDLCARFEDLFRQAGFAAEES